MFTKSDIESLRANGTSDRDILQMTARVIPSASKALRDIDADKTTPDMRKTQIMKEMIDRNAKTTGPSMLPYVSAITVNSATKKHDTLQSTYQKQEQEYMKVSDPTRFSTQHLQSAIGKPENIDEALTSGIKGGVVGSVQAGYNMVKTGVDLVKHLPSTLVGAAAIPAGAAEETLARIFDPFLSDAHKAPDTWERQQFMSLMKSTGIADIIHSVTSGNADQAITGADTALNFAFQHPFETAALAEGGVRGVNKVTGKDITTPSQLGKVITDKVTSIPSKAKGAVNALRPANTVDPDAGFQRAVQPKLTTADTKKLLESDPRAVQQGMNKAGVLKKSPGADFTPEDASLGKVAKTIEGYKPVKPDKPMTMKEAVDNSVAVHEAIAKDAKALKAEMIRKGDGAIPRAETTSRITSRLEGIKKYFKGDEAKIDSVQTLAKEIAEGHKGTWSGQWDARIEFYRQAQLKWGKNIFDKGNVVSQAVDTVGAEWNSVIHDAAVKAGVDFTPQMQRLSSMYDIKSNLATHVTNDVYNSAMTNVLKNNPAVRVATKAAASTAGMSMGLELLRE